LLIFHHQPADPADFFGRKSIRIYKLHRVEPKFSKTVTLFNVNMGQLVSFVAVKEKAIASDFEYSWLSVLFSKLTFISIHHISPR